MQRKKSIAWRGGTWLRLPAFVLKSLEARSFLPYSGHFENENGISAYGYIRCNTRYVFS